MALATLGVLYGCGQASSPPERQEKEGGVEEAAPVPATTLPSQGTPSSQSAQSQDEWIASCEAITLEEFRALDASDPFEEDVLLGLLSCQLGRVW